MLSALFGLRYLPRHVDSGKLCVSHSVIPVSWLFICLALCSLSPRLSLLPRSLFHLHILPLSCSFPLSPSYSLVSLFYFALGRFLPTCDPRCFSFTLLPLCFAPYLPLTLKTQSLFILLLSPHLSLFFLLFVFTSVSLLHFLKSCLLPLSVLLQFYGCFTLTLSHPFLSSSSFFLLSLPFLCCSFLPSSPLFLFQIFIPQCPSLPFPDYSQTDLSLLCPSSAFFIFLSICTATVHLSLP